MKTHVDTVHSHLVVKRKYILNGRALVKLFKNISYLVAMEKRVKPTSSPIIVFFGLTNLYKSNDEA
jgi:hypothetical protein